METPEVGARFELTKPERHCLMVEFARGAEIRRRAEKVEEAGERLVEGFVLERLSIQGVRLKFVVEGSKVIAEVVDPRAGLKVLEKTEETNIVDYPDATRRAPIAQQINAAKDAATG